MLRWIGLPSRRARSSASLPHGYHSTGLWACCLRYGLVSVMRWLVYFGVPSGFRCAVCIVGSGRARFYGLMGAAPLALSSAFRRASAPLLNFAHFASAA